MKIAVAAPARVNVTAEKNRLIARIWPRFASSRSVFSSSNWLNARGSRVKSCTIAMPLMFSFRYALIRASRIRTARNDSRIIRRK